MLRLPAAREALEAALRADRRRPARAARRRRSSCATGPVADALEAARPALEAHRRGARPRGRASCSCRATTTTRSSRRGSTARAAARGDARARPSASSADALRCAERGRGAARAGARSRSPTRVSGCATTSTRRTATTSTSTSPSRRFERLGGGRDGARRRARSPADGATPDDYEAVLAPLYAWMHAVARGRDRLRRVGASAARSTRGRVLTANGSARPLRRRALAAAFPLAVAALNRAGLGPVARRPVGRRAAPRGAARDGRGGPPRLGVDADVVSSATPTAPAR